MDPQTAEFYSTHAEELSRMYARSEGGIASHFKDAFCGSRKILDVGCGTGRDLLSLLRAGHDAMGIDACESMVAATRKTCSDAGVNPEGRVFQASLPSLDQFHDAEFDGLLCSAVLMHVPESLMFDAVYAIRRILKHGGRLLLSVPSQNDDIDLASRRDAEGRWFANLPPVKLSLLLERVGFRLEWEKTSPDSLGRKSRTWTVMLFTRADDVADRPLDTVESVLNRDKKDATYKLALFRALADIAQSSYNLARYASGARVLIPIEAIADKWLQYYWPLFEHDVFIPQRQGEKAQGARPIAFRQGLTDLITNWKGMGGLRAFLAASRSETLPAATATLHARLMSNLKETIWNMPVRYAGGGTGFSILQYDRKEKAVVMHAAMWRELSLTGSWIYDATVLRWAELTARLSNNAIRPSTVFDCLLSRADPVRDAQVATAIYKTMPGKHCTWTDQPIRGRFDVDHVIPFVLWRNNDLWNLLPVVPSVNNQKRDKLPTHRTLQRGKERVLGYWTVLRGLHPIRFDREAAMLCGNLSATNWKNELFGKMAEAVEITAIQRGIERWEPEHVSVLVQVPEAVVPSSAYSSPTNPARAETNSPSTENETCGITRRDYASVTGEAFVRYLPVVAALAAGEAFDGFEVGNLEWATDCAWVPVPPRFAGRNRFVIEVAGDSMTPTLSKGDLVVFEYHRSPRGNNPVVIANLTAFGIESSARTTGAVKRLLQDAKSWIFRSDNTAYQDIFVPKAECQYPILGVLVGTLQHASPDSQVSAQHSR